MAVKVALVSVVSVILCLSLQYIPSSVKQDAYYASLSLFDRSYLFGTSASLCTQVDTDRKSHIDDFEGCGLFHNGSLTFPPEWLDDRRRLQGRWSVADKGWLVPLTWGPAPKHGGGIGVYAVSNIKAGTLIRKSTIDENLYRNAAGHYHIALSDCSATELSVPSVFLRMKSYEDLEKFARGRHGQASIAERAALLRYISDYLFVAREPFGSPAQTNDSQRVFGMWVPGCADNDANPDETPNVEDRLTRPEIIMKGIPPTPTSTQFMGMYAMRDIAAGEILLNDYDGAYGSPPEWAARFANNHLGGWLAFAGHNHKAIHAREAISGAA